MTRYYPYSRSPARLVPLQAKCSRVTPLADARYRPPAGPTPNPAKDDEPMIVLTRLPRGSYISRSGNGFNIVVNFPAGVDR